MGIFYYSEDVLYSIYLYAEHVSLLSCLVNLLRFVFNYFLWLYIWLKSLKWHWTWLALTGTRSILDSILHSWSKYTDLISITSRCVAPPMTYWTTYNQSADYRWIKFCVQVLVLPGIAEGLFLYMPLLSIISEMGKTWRALSLLDLLLSLVVRHWNCLCTEIVSHA